MKKGKNTSEFWLSLVTAISGILMSIFPDNPVTNIAGGLIASLTAPTYAASRAFVKAKHIRPFD